MSKFKSYEKIKHKIDVGEQIKKTLNKYQINNLLPSGISEIQG